jgi:hypothetical protein
MTLQESSPARTARRVEEARRVEKTRLAGRLVQIQQCVGNACRAVRITEVDFSTTRLAILQWDWPAQSQLDFPRGLEQILVRPNRRAQMRVLASFIPQQQVKAQPARRAVHQVRRIIGQSGNPMPAFGSGGDQPGVVENLPGTQEGSGEPDGRHAVQSHCASSAITPRWAGSFNSDAMAVRARRMPALAWYTLCSAAAKFDKDGTKPDLFP